jgi:hypothetical protein
LEEAPDEIVTGSVADVGSIIEAEEMADCVDEVASRSIELSTEDSEEESRRSMKRFSELEVGGDFGELETGLLDIELSVDSLIKLNKLKKKVEKTIELVQKIILLDRSN